MHPENEKDNMKKTLVAGWFSFEQMGATAGDILTRDVVCGWLSSLGREFDLALAPPFTGGVRWNETSPDSYSHVVFVCGPFGNGAPVTEFLARFARCRLIGINLTMLHRVEEWNPFHLLLERDSSSTERPDLAFLSEEPKVPFVGLVLIHPQKEYRDRSRSLQANQLLTDLAAANEMAAIKIDTRLDVNASGFKSAREIESAIARCDVVLTTRLHGTVLAIKNGVPPVVIDPVAGGAKIMRQAKALGWPHVFELDSVTANDLQAAYKTCLLEPTRQLARSIAEQSRRELETVRLRFTSEFV
jgi:hypothetical protein